MKTILFVMISLGGVAFSQAGQPEKLTAHQYYEELKAASGVNRFATLVCFRSDQPEIFDLIAFTKGVEARAAAQGTPLTPADRKMFDSLDSLFVQTYNKGVKVGEGMMAHSKTEEDDWDNEEQFDGHKMRLIISVSRAGRYRRAVYLDKNLSPQRESFGKCDSIQ